MNLTVSAATSAENLKHLYCTQIEVTGEKVQSETKYDLKPEKSNKEIGDPLYWKPSAQDASSVGTAQAESKYYTIPDNGSEATQSDGKLYHLYHY